MVWRGAAVDAVVVAVAVSRGSRDFVRVVEKITAKRDCSREEGDE
jgi:hypothetical protein